MSVTECENCIIVAMASFPWRHNPRIATQLPQIQGLNCLCQFVSFRQTGYKWFFNYGYGINPIIQHR